MRLALSASHCALADTSAQGSTSVPRRSHRLDRGDHPIRTPTRLDCDWARRVSATSPDGTTVRLARSPHRRQIGLPRSSCVTSVSSASLVAHRPQDPDAPDLATAGMPGRCSAGGRDGVEEPRPTGRLRGDGRGVRPSLTGVDRCVRMSSDLERVCPRNDPKNRLQTPVPVPDPSRLEL